MTGIAHPEVVNGRRLWMDGSVRELIDRIRFGDTILGWEGDPRIELYYDGVERRFELWRLEDDNEYRRVCRSLPDMAFDDRVIHALVQWDGRRRTSQDLVDDVNKHNDHRRAQLDAEQAEWSAELSDRLRHAIRKEL